MGEILSCSMCSSRGWVSYVGDICPACGGLSAVEMPAPTPPESTKPEGKVVGYINDNGILILPSKQHHERAGWLVDGGQPRDSWQRVVPASDYEAMRAERDALKQEVDYVTSIHQNCARTLDEVLETRRSVEAQLKGAIELGAEDMQRADSLTRRLTAMQRECEGLREALAGMLRLHDENTCRHESVATPVDENQYCPDCDLVIYEGTQGPLYVDPDEVAIARAALATGGSHD